MAAPAPAADSFDVLREEGKQLFAAGDVNAALTVYREALRCGAAPPSAPCVRYHDPAGPLPVHVAGSLPSSPVPLPQRHLLLSNIAACLLRVPSDTPHEQRDALLECVAVCSDVLEADPRHRKARWRRAQANRRLGYVCVSAIDAKLLACIDAARAAPSHASAELATVVQSPEFRAASDPLHCVLCGEGGEAAMAEARWESAGSKSRSAQLDAFFANGGEVSLAYMLRGACVRPALNALLVLRRAVEVNVADVVAMHALIVSLRHALENDTGRMVKEHAGDCLAYIIHHLAEQPDGQRCIREFLDGYDIWPSVVHLMSAGLAVRQALNLGRLVVKHLGAAAGSVYVHMFCVGATLLWRHPERARLEQDLVDSMAPPAWDVIATALGNEGVVDSMKDDLIQLAKYKDAAVSSDAATLIGVIEEILHPEDHCRMEPVRLPVSALTDVCAACGAAAPQARCEYCLLTFYCGEECQAADWVRHGRYCGERGGDDATAS